MSIAPSPHPIHTGARPVRGPRLNLGRLLLGLVVVTLGVLLVLDAAGSLDAGEVIGNWWPVVLIAIGVIHVIEGRDRAGGPLLLIGTGVILLLFATGAVTGDQRNYVWGASVILVGLYIIVRWRRRPVPLGADPSEVVRATGIFSGSKVMSSSGNFRGAGLTAMFGGVTLDLRDATPSPPGARVNATALFGGIELIVPRGWRIDVNGTPILGGIDDKTDHSIAPAEDAPRLTVDALAMFGGVEIKHDRTA